MGRFLLGGRRRGRAAVPEMRTVKSSLEGPQAPCRVPPPRLRLGGSPRRRAGGGASQQMVQAGSRLLARPALASGAARAEEGRAAVAAPRRECSAHIPAPSPLARLPRPPPLRNIGRLSRLQSPVSARPAGLRVAPYPRAAGRDCSGGGGGRPAGREARRARFLRLLPVLGVGERELPPSLA